MKTSIDIYIRKATRGLPERERLDTAAELRVHLNRRAEELGLDGFSREEAEHLAVEGMGPVEGVNRRFLGHMFTVRSGWVALSVLGLGIGLWWGFTWWQAQRPQVVFAALSASPFEDVMGIAAGVSISLPPGIHSVKAAIFQGDTLLSSGTFPLEGRKFEAVLALPQFQTDNCDKVKGYAPLYYSRVVPQ